MCYHKYGPLSTIQVWNSKYYLQVINFLDVKRKINCTDRKIVVVTIKTVYNQKIFFVAKILKLHYVFLCPHSTKLYYKNNN